MVVITTVDMERIVRSSTFCKREHRKKEIERSKRRSVQGAPDTCAISVTIIFRLFLMFVDEKNEMPLRGAIEDRCADNGTRSYRVHLMASLLTRCTPQPPGTSIYASSSVIRHIDGTSD